MVQNRRCRAATATCRIAGREVVLAKPETFMNLSGLAVAALIREFEADPAKDLLVIQDELDLTLGTFKIRERGSPAGHNGASSVTGALGTQGDCGGRQASRQGLSALAHAQGGPGGSRRGARPGDDSDAAHPRSGAGSRHERVQSERQGTGNREQGSGNRDQGSGIATARTGRMSRVLKGCSFSRMSLRDTRDVLKGHDFSRAATGCISRGL